MKIAVASGKGGTGKTTLAVALSALMPGSVYVDMDVEEPNGKIFLKPQITESMDFTQKIPEIQADKCTYCGKCADACEYNAISIIKPIKKALFFSDLCHSCGVCVYVCPEDGAIIEVDKSKGKINFGKYGGSTSVNFIEGILNVGEPSAVPLISGVNRELKNNEGLFVLDAPPGTSCPVVATLEDVDYVVLVTEPTPFGLNDLKLALEVVRELGKPYGMVVNKHDLAYTQAESFAKENEVEIIGRIPFDRKIAQLYSEGLLLGEMSDKLKQELSSIVSVLERKLGTKLGV